MNSIAFKKFLLDRGVRQVDLARRIGVTRGAISQVVNGIAWNSNVRERMAEILGVSPDDLPFNPAVLRPGPEPTSDPRRITVV